MSVFSELPPPPRSENKSLNNKRTRYQFVVIINGFALIYHLLHKFIMPLVVIFTTSLPTPSTEKVDWWWLYHAILAYFLMAKKTHWKWLAGVVAFGFGGLTVQALEGVGIKNWHTFSLWLTAATTLVVLLSLVTLLDFRPTKRTAMIWLLGLVLGVCVEGSMFYFYGSKPYEFDARTDRTSRIIDKIKIAGLLTAGENCGTQAFSLKWYEGKLVVPELKSHDTAEVKDCGFAFAMSLYPEDGVTVHNASGGYANVKVNSWNGRIWDRELNFPLADGNQNFISKDKLQQQDVWLLASDAKPELGVILFVRDVVSLEKVIAQMVGSRTDVSLITFDRSGIKIQ